MPASDNLRAQVSASRLYKPGSPVTSSMRIMGIILAGLFYVAPVYAYVDPGTGSIILQGLLAGVAVVITSVSMFWQRIRSFFSSLFSPRKSTDPSPDSDPNPED
jgi:hypothetical protein